MADTIKCPKCGAENPKTNKFCDTCGNKLVKEEVKKQEPVVKEKPEKLLRTEKKQGKEGDHVSQVFGEAADGKGFMVGGFAINWETIIWLLIIIVTLITRFADLGTKPLHHDESMHAFYGWKLFKGDGYQYNPMMHGPFHYHANALIYFLFGTCDYTSRVAPAIYGLIGVLLIYFYRPYLGKVGAMVTALLMAVSPAFMYQARFIREDIFMAVDTVMLVIGLFRFFDSRKPGWLYLAATGLALSWCTKEATYITLAIFGSYFFFRWLWEYSLRNTEKFKEENVIHFTVEYLMGKGRGVLFAAFLVFFGICLFLYTTMFSYWKGIIDAFTSSLTYWMGQHEVKRGSQPWYYYILLMPYYETISTLFGIIAGVYYVMKREKRTLFNIFLVYWAVGATILYSYAGERMPWLILHVLTPYLILAGKFIGEIITNTEWKSWRITGIVVAILLTLGSIHGAIYLCFYGSGASPYESLVYVQTSTDVTMVVKRIQKMALDVKGTSELNIPGGEDLQIVCEDYCSWPFAWYLRDFKAVSYPHPISEGDKGKPIILSGIEVAAPGHDDMVKQLLKDDYVGTRYKLREWWAPDVEAFKKFTLQEKISWLWKRYMYRDIWSPLGSYDFIVYVRKDLEKYFR